MEIKFSLTGAARKELVTAVSEIVGWAPIYKKAPTFEYAVSDYIIDKNGTLKGDITQGLLDALSERGFVASENAAAVEIAASEEQAEADAPELAPEAGTGGGRAAEEEAEAEVHGLLLETDTSGDSGADEPLNAAQAEMPDTLVIEMPKNGFTDETVVNLEKLIASKAGLIKKALGADDLKVEQTETTLKFPWFRFNTDTDSTEANAYARFISALCEMAKEQKRVTAKEKEVENEKYAFRCFLLRLGFIGSDYKSERKILLQNLTGNTAFRNGRPQTASDETEHSQAVNEMPAVSVETKPDICGGKVMA